MLSVPLASIFVFRYLPFLGLQIAFKDYKFAAGIWKSGWVGFKHFIRFFNSYAFLRVLGNTLVLNIYNLIAGFPFPIVLALCLNYVDSKRFRKSLQMVSYAPHFISTVVVVGMVMQFLGLRQGVVNNFINLFGFKPVDFLGNPRIFKSIYVWSEIWQHAGYSAIIYIATLASIDPTLYEAAIVDGSTKYQRLLHIDIPSVLPTAIVLLILNTGQLLNSGFEKVLLLQNPTNIRTSEVIDTFVYKIGLSPADGLPNYSYATAIGLFKSVIAFCLVVCVNRIARKMQTAHLW